MCLGRKSSAPSAVHIRKIKRCNSVGAERQSTTSSARRSVASSPNRQPTASEVYFSEYLSVKNSKLPIYKARLLDKKLKVLDLDNQDVRFTYY